MLAIYQSVKQLLCIAVAASCETLIDTKVRVKNVQTLD